MKSREIRERFLAFFEARGHVRVPSASLIPSNDPSLLFTNAGMNQFKDSFLGHVQPEYATATSSQKCVRAGGKHNDLDNVGYTARHNTFFEMLGNFSFGDYFKAEAISQAWLFLTQDLLLASDRLFVTVYEEDDDAFAIWRDQVGLPVDRIFRFGKKDNFWSMGDSGPCGPCSEIFYDYGDAVAGPADPFLAIESGSDKIVEIWNLVFMQFNRSVEGKITLLPNPSVDTGMGLERICSVMQGVSNNYDTDLFQVIIIPLAKALQLEYGQDQACDSALRVIADHLRAMCFLIADGVNPSNEGRGYVLRRIMRRAMRYGKQLGQLQPFLFEMTRHVVAAMGEVFPELVREQNQIEVFVKAEELQFDSTLSKGLPILNKYLSQFKEAKRSKVPGQVMLFMYGTHGFPVDLMEDIARDWGMTLDHAEFDRLAEEDALASKVKGDFSKKQIPAILLEDASQFHSEMSCYTGLKGQGTIRRLLLDQQATSSAQAGCELEVITDCTPFYAESGGQVGDVGLICTETGRFQVRETSKLLDKLVLHKGFVLEGQLSEGQQAELMVDAQMRADTKKNHTATHILHQALRDVVGVHVRQAGSLVDPEKLRFDFNHFHPLSAAEIKDIETRVNQQVLSNEPVVTRVLAIEDARQCGAIAIFGEKYGDTVRVVKVGDFSTEFCGGTHVTATGEIGSFKIISERGLSAGVRRLVALTGTRALARFQDSERLLSEASERFHFTREDFITQLAQASEERRLLVNQLADLKMQLAKGSVASDHIEVVSGFKVLLKQVTDVGGGQIRQLADELMSKIKDGVVLLGSELNGKVQLIVKTNRAEVHSGKLVGLMAKVVSGKGGGRPDMAMAGGKDVAKLAEALEAGLQHLKTSLSP